MKSCSCFVRNRPPRYRPGVALGPRGVRRCIRKAAMCVNEWAWLCANKTLCMKTAAQMWPTPSQHSSDLCPSREPGGVRLLCWDPRVQNPHTPRLLPTSGVRVHAVHACRHLWLHRSHSARPHLPPARLPEPYSTCTRCRVDTVQTCSKRVASPGPCPPARPPRKRQRRGMQRGKKAVRASWRRWAGLAGVGEKQGKGG